MATTRRKVTIPTERAAFNLLSEVISGKTDAAEIEVQYQSAKWARFDVVWEGGNLNSSLTSDMMRALIEYQNTVYRAAAYLSSDRLSGRALKDDDRERIELLFQVKKGSSAVTASGWKAIQEIAGKLVKGMSPREKTIVILTLLLLAFGAYTLPSYLKDQVDLKKSEQSNALRAEENASTLRIIQEENKAHADDMKVLQQALAEQSKLAEIYREFQQSAVELLRQSPSRAAQVTIQGVEVAGITAKTLTTSKRRSSNQEIMEGVFAVDAADADNPSGFLCKVRRVPGGEVFQAGMFDSLMSERDSAIIRNAFWKKTKVHLKLQVRIVGGGVRQAKILSAKVI